MPANKKLTEITGHCYCGAVNIHAAQLPRSVVYCHCDDCRRSTGAPVAAFAAFDEAMVTITPLENCQTSTIGDARRSFCKDCGSPLTGKYDYLPEQIYLPLGLLDQANQLPPQTHAHDGERLAWLHIDDELERFEASARVKLNESISDTE